MKINQIAPEAKEAAIDARLDNNQRALLKIAKAGGQKAQLKMVAELAKISKRLNAPTVRAAKQSATGDNAPREKFVQSPPLAPDTTQSATNEDDATEDEAGKCRPTQKTTTYDEMDALWNPECRAGWASLPLRDRERFIEKLRRARIRAGVDVVEFLNDVLRGRQRVSKRDLYGFAATQGFAKSSIRKALKELVYRTKRKGYGSEAIWFVLNPDRDWKEQLPCYSDAKLKAAGDDQSDPGHSKAAKMNWLQKADYFKNI